MIDPFKVIRKTDISLKLQLLQAIKIDHSFHLNHFQKTQTNLLTSPKIGQ